MSLHFPSQSAAIWTVAKKLGIDLPTVIRDGDMTPEDLAGMLRACAHCWHGRKCARWQEGSDHAAMASFCPSAETVNALAQPETAPDGAARRPYLRAVR
ncbi:DUF6455 family protein [Pararhodobacter sp. CCB-MM2]|uniref:DUF6455 family protein n=1 Tax=Pararhodobacter sp. CCB-MM2 TaxID=1786003 RepID=UPI00082BBF38|nr:DUF6455 family protein [Pararhodobacter sp. CCB-MM2]MCA2011934.1 DUF6455 family protein [Cereibacter sphaeroides]